jgi:hypothetical protein
MHKHCITVDKFGFGSYEEVLSNVEETMSEIWVTTLEFGTADVSEAA